MLVPIPHLVPPAPDALPVPSAPPAPAAPSAPGAAPAAPVAVAPPPHAGGKTGWSCGAKVAAGAGVAGLAVAGALLGEHIAEEGLDATLADLGDGFEAAGDAIVDGAEAGADWIEDA